MRNRIRASDGTRKRKSRNNAVAAMRCQQYQPPHQDEDKHMKIGDMIESRYLKQSDVPDPVIATIVALKKVNVARDDEEADYRWTIRFAEWPKPMVCNV